MKIVIVKTHDDFIQELDRFVNENRSKGLWYDERDRNEIIHMVKGNKAPFVAVFHLSGGGSGHGGCDPYFVKVEIQEM